MCISFYFTSVVSTVQSYFKQSVSCFFFSSVDTGKSLGKQRVVSLFFGKQLSSKHSPPSWTWSVSKRLSFSCTIFQPSPQLPKPAPEPFAVKSQTILLPSEWWAYPYSPPTPISESKHNLPHRPAVWRWRLGCLFCRVKEILSWMLYANIAGILSLKKGALINASCDGVDQRFVIPLLINN